MKTSRPAGGDFDPVVVPDDLPPPPVRPVQAPAPAWLAWGLAAVLAFAVFAFGAVEDWSSATVEVALFALAALAAYGGVPGFLKRPVRLGAPALVVALLALAGRQ